MFFSDAITAVPNANIYFMTTFDIENLVTNIPLRETITICLNYIFTSPNGRVIG